MLDGPCHPVADAADTPPPPSLPAPLAGPEPAGEDADTAWTAILAQRALQAGLHHLAEGLFRQALARPEITGESRRTLELGLVSALLAQGAHEDALKVLEQMEGEHDGAWELRRAIVDYEADHHDRIEERLESIAVDKLPPADVAWAHFLRAVVKEAAGEPTHAETAFQEALAASMSAAASAWIHVAEFQMRLNTDEPSEALLKQIEKTMDEFAGRPLGYEATLQYAAALARLGRKPEAVQALLKQRRALPAGETELRDKTRLLLGLIAGVDSPDGYSAMLDLLEQGSDTGFQRIALQRLADAADTEGSLARAGLPQLLDSLLKRTPPHPLTEDLLYYRAALALRPPNPSLERAEADANALLAQFPGSALRPAALALLASSSWQRERYRTAADYVTRLRNEITDLRQRTRLAVLAAECHFRAGQQAEIAEDYRNAADAYATAQEDMAKLTEQIGAQEATLAAGVTAGSIFFHHALALLNSGNLDGTAALLTSPVATTINPDDRWQAVWNYVRQLQLKKRSAEAFTRLEQWGAADDTRPELRLRFLWLIAQLTLETGRSSETPARVAALRDFLAGPDGGKVPPEDREQVEPNAALLLAEAQLDQNQAEAGFQALDQLRHDYPRSNAAIYSYIIQARHLSATGQLVEAQKLLRDLADQYPDSEYAPRALYEAAEQAKKRGADAYMIEARDLLEKLATSYPKSRFVYAARLEQGDILRRLNQFAAAEQVYLLLENSPAPSEAYRNIAQLSLADTLLAQVDNDPTKFEAAISRLERLTDLPPPADPDLRIEAGFKLGYAWQKHGNADRAAEIYWDLYQRVFGQPRPGRPSLTLGTRGPYWMARTLLELGEIEARAGRRDQAHRAYQSILDRGLPGRDVVQGRLDALAAGG